MKRQWIGIEEAATKYQVSSRRIYKWCDKRKVTFTEIDDYLLLDENSLIEYIEHDIRCGLNREELQKRMEEELKQDKEKLFVLQSLKDLTPIIRILIEELSNLIRNNERRELFLFITLQGSLKEYAAQHHKSTHEAQGMFQSLVLEVKNQAQYLRDYKELNIFLNSRLKSYELSARTKGEVKESDKPQLTENINALLNTPICELGFNTRVQHAFALTNMETLRHLLLFTRTNGFKKLCSLRQFGSTSQANVEFRLKELNILDAEGNCELYQYLDEQ